MPRKWKVYDSDGNIVIITTYKEAALYMLKKLKGKKKRGAKLTAEN
jgi:hypothetical protein